MTDSIRARLIELIVPHVNYSSERSEYGYGFIDCRNEVIANIERLASEAKVVSTRTENVWADHNARDDYYSPSHTAILLDIQPIRRKVKVSEIVEAMRKADWSTGHLQKLNELADRLEREGVEHE